MSAVNDEPLAKASRPRMPRSIWALGIVSLLMDTSSEMIHSLLPVFLVASLGASAAVVGLIEGAGETAAAFTKVFSGWLSDRTGRRKALTVFGYSLGALAKPFFAVATSAGWVLGARLGDRVGKGIRGAPRDAMVGELAPLSLRGAAYGLRQSLDSVGAIAGPLLAIVLMGAFAGEYRRVFWVAVIPAALAVLVLVFGVREPARSATQTTPNGVLHWRDVVGLGRNFWLVVVVGSVFTLARFSEAFLILRAQHAGLSAALVPLTLVVMNAVYASSAYPVGALSDRVSRWTLLQLGFAVLLLADVVLAFAPSLGVVFLGIALWGLQMGMTQGLLAALVADTAPSDRRGTAFGVFHLATGVALLLASVVAGVLWDHVGPSATFLIGAGFTLCGIVGAAMLRRTSDAR